MKEKKPTPSTREMWAILSGLGFTVAVPPAFFAIVGVYLDAYTNTKPLFLLLGLLFGLSAGVIGAVKMLQRFFQDVKK